MSAKDDGGQAFPTEFYETEHGDRVQTFAGSPGMTLRDWFAGQAINGMLANGLGPNSQWTDDPPSAARWAYEIADAMIAERKK